MPSLTFPYSFSARTLAQSSQVNANFNAISTLLNSTKLDSSNIQTGGIATANYAAGSVDTAAIQDANVTTAKIADANVTTAKIADANVTTAKIANANVTAAKIANNTITATQIANNTITATQIANATITGTQIASSVNLAGTPSSASETLVVAATNYATSTRLVYGWVGAAGSPIGGAGFTSSKTATGTFLVTFNTAMGTDPFVAVSPIYVNIPYIVMQSIIDHGGFAVRIFDLSGTAVDADFSFIAAGPR